MPPSQVEWSLPVTVLVVGLVVGALFVWRQFFAGRSALAGGAVPGSAPLELRDLEGRRDVLLAQLRELEDTAAKRSPEQLARERYALELEAARVLRDLERHPSTRSAARVAAASAGAAPGAVVSAPAPVRNSAAGGFLWGIGTAAVIGVLLFYVSRSATTRDEGGSATGNVPAGMGRPAASQGAGQAPAPANPEEQSLRAVLQRNPDDLDARIALAQVHLGNQDMMGAWNETQYVLQRQPGDPRALVYQAPVRLAMGQPDLALETLQRALAAEPGLIDGYVYMALAYRRLGRNQDAEAVMADALKRFPQQNQPLSAVFEELRRNVTAQETAPAPGGANPHAGLGADAPAGEQAPAAMAATAPPAGAAPSGGAAAPADAGRNVAGVIELDPALAGQVPAGATLFLVVREARLQRGPPAAVKRLQVSGFPMRFELSDKDSMAGEPLPDPLRIEARIDSDGNAMTRDPGDPTVVEDGVRTGTTNLRLVLRRQ